MILVTGSTGFIGRRLVARLQADGHAVRVLLAPSWQGLPHPWGDDARLDVVVGTLEDEESAYRAATGVYTVFHLDSPQWWGRPKELLRAEHVGTRHLLEAARAARVGRVLYLSHLGATATAGYALMRAKGVGEELVKASGLAYTIVRSGVVFGEDDAFCNHIAMLLRANPFFFPLPGRGEGVLHPIYVDDLVTALVRALDLLDTVDTTVEVGGAEYLTLEELVRTIMRVSGHQRPMLKVPPYALRWTTGLQGRLRRRTLMTPQWLDLLATNRVAPLGSTYRVFGFHPRRFEDTLLTYMPARDYLWDGLRYGWRPRPRQAR